MKFDKSLLHNIKKLSFPVIVTLPNSYKVKVYCVGSVYLSPVLELHNVLFVPSFKHNLLSVYKLCNQFDCLLIFSKLGCAIQVPSLKRDLVFGDANAGLYVLRENISQQNSTFYDQHFQFL